jgi:uncharacterized protein CbrC (UPF0167 family)
VAGRTELEALGEQAISAIRDESGYDGDEWEEYFEGLDKDHGSSAAYVFRCRHCRTFGGYSDFD